MKTFWNFSREKILKEDIDEIGSEFQELLKRAQDAYDNGEYDKAYDIINTAETKSEAEESLKRHFTIMLSSKRDTFNTSLGEY